MRQRLQRLLEYRYRLSGQFILGIGGAVALTFAASLVGWFSFDRVANVQRRVNEGSVPEMVAAFGVAQYASNLVAAAPRLTTAATAEEFAGVASRITATHRAFQEELDALQQAGADGARIARVRAHADMLLSNIEAISNGMATQASTQAILTARTLLLLISGISLGGPVLIAWLFVGRMLLRWLGMLSDWMRRMVGGDLEARVAIGGRDEVADMAAALEVFRRHALEVPRLNLVERPAEELQGKNDQLEKALQDLAHAQDRIVMREKLAALGELTAGVAHEIRKPAEPPIQRNSTSLTAIDILILYLITSIGTLFPWRLL